MPLSFMTDSVTVLRAQIVKKHGSEAFDWANIISTTLTGVQVTPQQTSREFGDRTLQITERYTLRAPYNADIRAGDRIVWRSETYEIDGDVFHTESPTGRVSSTRCTLAKWSG